MTRIPALVCTACCALLIGSAALRAETFSVKLGQTVLGHMTHIRNGPDQELRSTLDNTPLGVFDGTFVGTSRRVKTAAGMRGRQFQGTSRSSRKSRMVTVQIEAGRAVQTDVVPPSELTELSDPTRAPGGVIDPVQAVGKLIASKGCPRRITIYEGRRAIALQPVGSLIEPGLLHCDIAYDVVAGPGHLSPLRITSAKMRLTYDTTVTPQNLTRMTLKSGIFLLTLDRSD